MKANVLIISNHANHRVAYAAALAGYGYNVLEAPTLHDAHDFLAATPRVVVLDLRLSTMNPDDITGLMSNLSARLIVIGNSADEQLVAHQLNAAAFLNRPANLDDLLRSIA
jgi:DNA-binding NtrC family response regulator